MDAATIAATMSKAVGDPTSGLLADAIPSMAAAVAEALNPKGKGDDRGQDTGTAPSEKRIVKASETR